MVKALIIISYFFTAFFAVGSVVSQDNQSQPVYSVAIEADDVVSRVIFNAASYRFHFQVNYVTFPVSLKY